MNVPNGKFSVFDFLRKTLLWIALLPLPFIGIGAALNQAVLVANNDTFPVRANVVKVLGYLKDEPEVSELDQEMHAMNSDAPIMLDNVHCVMTSKTHLNFLADNFDFEDSICSIGDLLLDLGEWLAQYALIVWAILVVQRLRKQDAQET
jgi:hypothetical protein